MAAKELVFSGVQPTGNLHLGNYLGAIVNFVKLQQTHNCIYCVVDMHAITQPYERDNLAQATREVAAAYIELNPDTEMTEDEVVRHCVGAIASYKIPRRVVCVDELPRNSVGKVTRFVLSDRYGASREA